MPRIDGYPAADTLSGSEVLPGMQGGVTKSITLDQLTNHVQALLEPLIAQMIANAVPVVPVVPGSPRLISDTGSLLADDLGGHLLAA